MKTIALMVLVAASGVQAQQVLFPDCNAQANTLRNKGTTVLINCDRTWILNEPAATQLLGEKAKLEATVASLQRAAAACDSVVATQNDIRAQYEGLRAAQDKSFQELLQKTNDALQAGRESVQNTDAALSLARRTRFASYISAGLVGATAGGLGLYIDRHAALPTLVGAVSGAALAIALDVLVLKVGAP